MCLEEHLKLFVPLFVLYLLTTRATVMVTGGFSYESVSLVFHINFKIGKEEEKLQMKTERFLLCDTRSYMCCF